LTIHLRSAATASVLAGLALLLYGTRLGSPIYSTAEVALLRQAQSVAVSGRDIEGHLTPLFFRVAEDRWLQPLPVYATAAVATVASAHTAGRLTAAVVGAMNVVLLFVLVRRLFPDPWVPVGAALLLMLTPAHFVYARTGVDAVFILPFVLVWLTCLVHSLNGGAPWRAALGALALGVGVYSQPSAPVTMVFLLVVTLAALWRSGCRSTRALATVVAAFAAPASAAVLWFAAYPHSYADTFGRWAVHAAHLRFPLDGLLAFINRNTLGTRVSLYWGFFDPSWLFFNGPTTPHSELQGASPFLSMTLILAALGISRRLQAGPAALSVVLLAGLAVAPLAASTFGQPHAIGSALAVVPFAIVLAAGGLAAWRDRASRGWQVLGWIVMALAALDFSRFYLSYLAA